ncbi:C45 family autoproteolytic acyltransferase/hydolase [Leifsonia shinshuensis]
MKLHHLTTTATDPRDRGREIGSVHAAHIRDVSARYLAHFELLGIDAQRVRRIVDVSHAALREWAPRLAVESDGIADGAGMAAWEVAAVGARTEVLAAAPGVPECSTAVHVPPAGGAPETIQTWDWHDGLTPDGLLLGLRTDGGRSVKLFTEFGTAAKIGVNDAGLGLHFNILRHASDTTAGGVPVHAIARRILEEAETIAEARALVASASVGASTVFTIATFRDGKADAASIELAPAGVAVVPPAPDGWLVHTNHFLDPELAAGDRSDPGSVTVERYDHVRAASPGMTALGPAERAAAFCGGRGEEAVVCMRHDPSKPQHEQWGTLLTIALDVPGFGLDYRAGTPDHAARDGFARF